MKCSSGVGFDPQVAGQTLTFDVSGLYKGVFMMRDRQTGTIWAHLDGNGSRGPLEGKRLSFIPVQQMTWGQWNAIHPETLVLDPNTPFQRRYDPPVMIGAPNPTESLYGDDRLPSNALVVGVEVKGAFVGFPLEVIDAADGVINTEVGGEPVLVLYDSQSQTGIAYLRTVTGLAMTFARDKSIAGSMTIRDESTGSFWDIHGTAIAGPFAGTSLTFVPSFISEWYGWSGYHPETGLYLEDNG